MRFPTLPPWLREFSAFTVIGGLAAAADVAILWFLTDVAGWHYLESAAAGFVVVTLAAFAAHKRFTFRCARKDRARQYAAFAAVNLAGFAVYAAALWCGTSLLGMWYLAAAVPAKGVAFVWNYGANKFFTFRKRADALHRHPGV